jgi:hypothetical protein
MTETAENSIALDVVSTKAVLHALRAYNFDEIDADLAKTRVFINQQNTHIPYANVAIKTKTVKLHRLIAARMIGRPLRADEVVDHIDHNTMNNKRSNLRVISKALNGANKLKQRTPTSSKYKGVYWDKEKEKWTAHIKKPGDRQRRVGYSTDEEEAARMYDTAAIAQWGEHAWLNFPRGEK